MARMRMVKPSLRTSRVVAQWKWEIRYFWVLLWGYLDDEGRGLDATKAIAGDCYPLDDKVTAATIERWLRVMASTKVDKDKDPPVCRYEVGGFRYIHCVNWEEHQKPNRPQPSRVPPCPVHESLTEPFTESVSERGSDAVTDSPVQGTGPVDNSSHRGSAGHKKRPRGTPSREKGGHRRVTNRDLDAVPKWNDEQEPTNPTADQDASTQVTPPTSAQDSVNTAVSDSLPGFEGLINRGLEGAAAHEPVTEPPTPPPQDHPPQSQDSKPPPRACRDHRDDPDPPACRRCATARQAHEAWHAARRARHDTEPRCPTHPGEHAANCRGCRADALAAS